ncbi:MAG: CPBP family intramembrane metalloprotease [Candidatus Dormibacteraeota bacterium]|nr:CPBP family intramembrane metalloprotease [Candidatus Dormibacteraeota bacterium]
MPRIDRQRIATAVRHLVAELRRSRLLMGYMALGILSGFGNGGPAGLIAAVLNYGLLALYGVIAFLWTEKDRRLVEPKHEMATVASRRRAATVIVVVVFAFAFGFAAWFWSHGLPFDVYWSVRHRLAGAGWNPALASKAANAVVVSAETVVLFALAMLVFRLRPGQLGLLPRRIMLGLVLAAAGIVLAPLSRLLTGGTSLLWAGKLAIPIVLGILAFQVFSNGLPEEFIFRGIILSRLVGLLRRPASALVLSSILFTAVHIPSVLASGVLRGYPWWIVVPGLILTPGPEPTGLAWGYLFYRARSIWPGVIWHTSASVLGCPFLGC